MLKGYPSYIQLLKRQWKHEPLKPNIASDRGSVAVEEGKPVFVVVCGPDFDITFPNAGMTCRMGWCRGFEAVGIPYLLLSVFDLADRLPKLSEPICFISAHDYQFLNAENLKALKKTKHFVWVNTWFKDDAEYYARNGFEDNSHPKKIHQKIMSSEPAFVFTISPQSSFEFYEMWPKHGLKLVSLPLACDMDIYMGDCLHVEEFDGVKMAFVGGYWAYKARQFDRYLKPYDDILKVFGYSSWPYAGYGGKISEKMEQSLYRQARLSPTVNEPHVETMGIDMNERVFKVLGSGGITVTDVVPAYGEWFSEEELLVPQSMEDYHDMVHKALHDEDFNLVYRKRGRNAVLARHTYAHRAKTALEHIYGDRVKEIVPEGVALTDKV